MRLRLIATAPTPAAASTIGVVIAVGVGRLFGAVAVGVGSFLRAVAVGLFLVGAGIASKFVVSSRIVIWSRGE